MAIKSYYYKKELSLVNNNNVYIQIKDRYDYANPGDERDIIDEFVLICYFAQQAGVITPFFTVINHTVPGKVPFSYWTYVENNQYKARITGLGNMPNPEIPSSIIDFEDNEGLYCKEYHGELCNIDHRIPISIWNSSVFSNSSQITSINISDPEKEKKEEERKFSQLPINIINNAFQNCSNLTNITMDTGSVSSIGDYAFSGCTKLTNITVPDGVTSIGNNAFRNCSSAASLYISSTVTGIGDSAFYGCTGFTNIAVASGNPAYKSEGNCLIRKSDNTIIIGCKNSTIPDYITSVDVNAFQNPATSVTWYYNSALRSWNFHNYLKTVVISNGVTSIGSYAFQECTSLTSVTIPDSVTSVGSGAFYGCTGITNITIPSSVASIGISAFDGCTNLSVAWNYNPAVTASTFHSYLKTVTISNSVTSISNNAFGNCTGLTNITIPNSVTNIGNSAFYGCTGLTEINIPSNITNIGYTAFAYCTGLTDIKIPSTVASAGESIFYGCTNLSVTWNYNPGVTASSFGNYLKTVKMPDGITSIGNNAFNGYTGLTNFDIPSSVASIGSSAFQGCTGLTSIFIMNNVTSIGADAFKNCSNLTIYTEAFGPGGWDNNWNSSFRPVEWGCTTGTPGLQYTLINNGTEYSVAKGTAAANGGQVVILPVFNGLPVTQIAACGFSNFANITSIIIPESIVSIGFEAFRGCSNLTRIIIPDSVTSMGTGVFMDCGNLVSIVMSNNITSLGTHMFYNCANLTNFIIPDSVINIDNAVFVFCDNLTSILIKNNVINIGNIAFYENSNLIIYVEATNKPVGWDSLWNYSSGPVVWNCAAGTPNLAYTLINNGTAYSVSKGTATDVNIKIPVLFNGLPVAEISAGGFYNFLNLKSIVIPRSITVIGRNAFYGCNNITIFAEALSKPSGWDANWNSSNHPVVWGCATGTAGLAYTLINNGTAYSVSRGTATGTDIIIPAIYNGLFVTEIAESGFVYRTNITNITIPNTVTKINNYAFVGCTVLTNIMIPNSIISIGDSAFQGCTNLTSITIPNSVTNMGVNTFYGCTGLTSVILSDNLIYIGYNTFRNCSSLTDIIIPNGVTSIGDSAFRNCSSLTSISIPSSVTAINYYVFQDCNNLISITIPNSVAFIGDSAFMSCTNLTIYTEAFKQPIWHPTWNVSNRPVVWGSILTGTQGLKYTLINKGTEYSVSRGTATDINIKIPNLYNGKLVTSIATDGFINFVDMTNIAIPNSITNIGKYAFYNCSNLTNIILLNNLTSINEFAFYGCNNLTIYAETANKPNGWDVNWNISNCSVIWMCMGTSGLSYMLINNDTAYSVSRGTATDANIIIAIIHNGLPVTEIAASGFYGFASLTNIIIPNSVKNIGSCAFYNCTGLTNITIPNSVINIGYSAFQGCVNLSSVRLPDDLIIIDTQLFYGCNNLTDIIIPNNVTGIGNYAFYGCANLISVIYQTV